MSILWHSCSLKYNAEAGFMEEWLLTKAYRPFFSSPDAFTPVHFCTLSITTVSFSLQTPAAEPNSRFDYLLLGWTYCVGLHTESSVRLQNSYKIRMEYFALPCFAFHPSINSFIPSTGISKEYVVASYFYYLFLTNFTASIFYFATSMCFCPVWNQA